MDPWHKKMVKSTKGLCRVALSGSLDYVQLIKLSGRKDLYRAAVKEMREFRSTVSNLLELLDSCFKSSQVHESWVYSQIQAELDTLLAGMDPAIKGLSFQVFGYESPIVYATSKGVPRNKDSRWEYIRGESGGPGVAEDGHRKEEENGAVGGDVQPNDDKNEQDEEDANTCEDKDEESKDEADDDAAGEANDDDGEEEEEDSEWVTDDEEIDPFKVMSQMKEIRMMVMSQLVHVITIMMKKK